MGLSERAPRISRLDRDRVRRMIDTRPALASLRIGYHLRNEAEALDILELLDKFIPERLYAAIAGSRKAGITIHSERRLKARYGDSMTPETIRGIRREWPLVAETVDGRLPLALPTVRHPKLANRPANAFFYDIDLVVVPRHFNAPSDYESETGNRSGTKIELFILSQQDMLREGHVLYKEAFLNSLRLPYPYIRHRKEVNFDRIFAGWRKEGRSVGARTGWQLRDEGASL